MRFTQMLTPSLMHNLETTKNPDSDFRTVVKAIRQVRKAIEDHQKEILSTIAVVLNRASFLLINNTIMSCLLAHTKSDNLSLRDGAVKLLRDVSPIFPTLYRHRVGDLMAML